jgi:hypothetical protein
MPRVALHRPLRRTRGRRKCGRFFETAFRLPTMEKQRPKVG